MPPGGLHIRWPDAPLEQEARLMNWSVRRARLRARQPPNHNVIEGRTTASASSPRARPTTTPARRSGTSASTTRPAAASACACTRSTSSGLEATITREFALGLEEILVVEEKRQVIEYQLKEQLYGWRPDVRPHVLGKFDESENDEAGGEWGQANPSQHWLLRAQADLTPAIIAKAIARRLARLGVDADVSARMTLRVALIGPGTEPGRQHSLGGRCRPGRAPWFCGGCPQPRPRCPKARAPSRHRLPLHGGLDGPLDRELQPDGR